jgi:hypothetical protein
MEPELQSLTSNTSAKPFLPRAVTESAKLCMSADGADGEQRSHNQYGKISLHGYPSSSKECRGHVSGCERHSGARSRGHAVLSDPLRYLLQVLGGLADLEAALLAVPLEVVDRQGDTVASDYTRAAISRRCIAAASRIERVRDSSSTRC